MKAALFLVFALIGIASATVGNFGGLGHGGEGFGGGELGAGAKGGAGYGGRKNNVHTTGYNRGFNYGQGHDTGKSVNIGDEEIGGKGFGDKGMREAAISGLGYGGLGYGGFAAPLFFFR